MEGDPVPWIGLLGLVAMFAIPFLPSWIFEGPRTVRPWPRRHLCGACGADWTSGHVCEAADQEPVLAPRQRRREAADQKPALPARAGRLTAELRRLDR